MKLKIKIQVINLDLVLIKAGKQYHQLSIAICYKSFTHTCLCLCEILFFVFCGGLNENGPQRPQGVTLTKPGFVEVGVALGGNMPLRVSFEVSEAQARPRGSISLPAACWSGCRPAGSRKRY